MKGNEITSLKYKTYTPIQHAVEDKHVTSKNNCDDKFPRTQQRNHHPSRDNKLEDAITARQAKLMMTLPSIDYCSALVLAFIGGKDC